MMAAKVRGCARRDRRMRNSGATWACSIDIDQDNLGTVTEVFCGDCTTAEEHTQREINDSTVDYIWLGDRVSLWPKIAVQ